MEEGFDDFIRKYFGEAGEQERSGDPDFTEAVESCASNHEKHCSNQDCDGLPCKSVEGVLNTMFQIGDHLEVFFEDEMIDSGGTFVAVFDSILIWVDYDANVNITDLCGPISVRKIGTKRKKKQKHKENNRKFNTHKRDDQNDKKKKNKAEKKEKGSRKKDGKNDQSGVNEELLNFVKLEKGEQAERDSQDPLILEQLAKDNETNEKESLTVEILDSTGDKGDKSVQGSFDEKEGGNNLFLEDSSNDSEAEYPVQLEPGEVQTVEEDLDQGIEEKSVEYESDLQDVLKDVLNIKTTEKHLASTPIDDDTVGVEESEETLSIMEETSSEEDLDHSSINSLSKW